MELFQILKDDALKVLHSICQQNGKLSSGHKTGKDQFSFPMPKKDNVKECSNYCTIALISHASKIMLTILQVRLQQYVNHELPDIQAGYRKGRGIRHQIAKFVGSLKKQESSKKKPHIYFCFIDYAKAVWIIIKCWKLSKRWEYHTTWPASGESICRLGSKSYNWTWENRLVPNRVRSMSRLYIVPLLL